MVFPFNLYHLENSSVSYGFTFKKREAYFEYNFKKYNNNSLNNAVINFRFLVKRKSYSSFRITFSRIIFSIFFV